MSSSNNSKYAALVLGMHRSGTSCFSRCLNILGYSTPKTLIPPDHSNKMGHWESRKIARLNDSILENLGLKWDSWNNIDISLLRDSERKSFKSDIISTIKSEFQRPEYILVKEPRICRFTSIYLDALRDLDYEINIFFNNETFNLVGWQTKDIYQNVNVTNLSSIQKNKQVNKDIFELPTQN